MTPTLRLTIPPDGPPRLESDRPHDWRLAGIDLPGGHLYECRACRVRWQGHDLGRRPDGPCGRGL